MKKINRLLIASLGMLSFPLAALRTPLWAAIPFAHGLFRGYSDARHIETVGAEYRNARLFQSGIEATIGITCLQNGYRAGFNDATKNMNTAGITPLQPPQSSTASRIALYGASYGAGYCLRKIIREYDKRRKISLPEPIHEHTAQTSQS